MKLAVGIFIACLVASCVCWIPFVYEPVSPQDPHYVLLLKHALQLVGSVPYGFRIVDYLIKDDIIESFHKVTYFNIMGELCHISYSVNSLVGTQVPTSPLCSYAASLNAVHTRKYPGIFQRSPYDIHNQGMVL